MFSFDHSHSWRQLLVSVGAEQVSKYNPDVVPLPCLVDFWSCPQAKIRAQYGQGPGRKLFAGPSAGGVTSTPANTATRMTTRSHTRRLMQDHGASPPTAVASSSLFGDSSTLSAMPEEHAAKKAMTEETRLAIPPTDPAQCSETSGMYNRIFPVMSQPFMS